MENKQVQDLSLDLQVCTDEVWEIQHEFLHSLGFWHEMQRGDAGYISLNIALRIIFVTFNEEWYFSKYSLSLPLYLALVQ